MLKLPAKFWIVAFAYSLVAGSVLPLTWYLSHKVAQKKAPAPQPTSPVQGVSFAVTVAKHRAAFSNIFARSKDGYVCSADTTIEILGRTAQSAEHARLLASVNLAKLHKVLVEKIATYTAEELATLEAHQAICDACLPAAIECVQDLKDDRMAVQAFVLERLIVSTLHVPVVND